MFKKLIEILDWLWNQWIVMLGVAVLWYAAIWHTAAGFGNSVNHIQDPWLQAAIKWALAVWVVTSLPGWFNKELK